MKFKNPTIAAFTIIASISFYINNTFAVRALRKSTVEDDIEVAKNICEIEDCFARKDAQKLREYLFSDRLRVANAAIRRIILLGDKSLIPALDSAGLKKYDLQYSTDMAKNFLMGKKPNENLDDFIARPVSSCFGEVFFEYRMLKEALNNGYCMNKSEFETYKAYKDTISSLSQEKALSYLVEKVWNFEVWWRIYPAIRILKENYRKAAIPLILSKLEDVDFLPGTVPPPYSSLHSRFAIGILFLKCIPDSTSLPLLDKLSRSSNAYIAQEARNAAIWIRSGTPFPIDYEYLMQTTD